MITYPMPRFEQQKIEVLQRYKILDGSKEYDTSHIPRTVSLVFDMPMVIVALNERYRKWFKSSCNMTDEQHDILQGFCAHAQLSDAAFCVEDARDEEYFAREEAVQGDPNVVFFAGAPLRNPDGIRFGTLCLIDQRPRTLDAMQMNILNSFAAMLSQDICLRSAGRYALADLIETEKDKSDLYGLAMTDSLTGALNRRAFFRFSEREMSRTRRYNLDMCVMMLDIDFFKKVNDVHGHNAGDMVLSKFVKTLIDTVRDEDLVGRLGGEEFAIVIPETSKERAGALADRIRNNVKAMRFNGDGGNFSISVSIGISEPAINETDIDPSLERADKALYEAKRAGRDRVVLADTPRRLIALEA
ncbi:sensor domain-containing diguanylate cyclase [Parvularcula sp. LCG005]|uniref:sensor domain-containing diguanylate cyclase n=1 Tax=Parvularcula sp. LCG005 TaxID=3078805 RepID=UPI002942A9F5|nr:sensor domain-containing diguanylate cyclase [Parvularcula sp. LCG005]WOI51994.1 sensor domain-containing diguanylate cyclase [Parvularcula sp. LCG005]